jgi:hypothetical protein
MTGDPDRAERWFKKRLGTGGLLPAVVVRELVGVDAKFGKPQHIANQVKLRIDVTRQVLQRCSLL